VLIPLFFLLFIEDYATEEEIEHFGHAEFISASRLLRKVLKYEMLK